MSDGQEIKCGKCEVALETFTNDDGEKRGRCPKCGNSDTVDNIHREVREFVQEHAARALHESLRGATRGNKSFKLTSNAPPKRRHRFIVDV